MNCAGVWKPASNVGGTALGPEAIRVCGETARTEIQIQIISVMLLSLRLIAFFNY